jgi:hypothetical protein
MVEAYRFSLPLTTEEKLRQFVLRAFGVSIPDVQVCENHTTPWRAFSDAYFAKSSIAVWKASRGFGGKSFLLALLGLTEAITLKANVNILGGSGEQSENVHSYIRDQFWAHPNAPTSLLVTDPSKRTTQLTWGNFIKALTASSKSVRGPHPQRLRLDEIDEMDLAIFDAAMGQTMEGATGITAQTVASSTHQYADATMTEVLRRAADKGWPVYEWCFRESAEGWLSTAEIERKRNEVTAAMWDVEYDLQEPSPETRAIDTESIKRMFQRNLGVFDGSPGEYIEIESPQPGASYVHGADWARKQDWTIIVTARIDVRPSRVVAFERLGRLPWPVMIKRFDERLKRYGGQAAHDGTGLGDVVNSYITQEAVPVMMVGRTRADMLSDYIGAVERGEYASPYIKFMESEHRLADVQAVYGAGHLPDSIAAMSLLHAVAIAIRRLANTRTEIVSKQVQITPGW